VDRDFFVLLGSAGDCVTILHVLQGLSELCFSAGNFPLLLVCGKAEFTSLTLDQFQDSFKIILSFPSTSKKILFHLEGSI